VVVSVVLWQLSIHAFDVKDIASFVASHSPNDRALH
jgi:hypothetical protein